jgi:flagellar biosynthetic protein FliR
MPSVPFATLDQFLLFLLVLGRVGGIVAATPMFGGKLVSGRIKGGMVFAITLVLFPVVSGNLSTPLPSGILSFGLLMIKESLIGITLGILSQMIFAAVEFCGHLVATQMGLSIALQFDPTIGMQVSALSVFQNLLAMLLFLSLDAHHIFFRAMMESYTRIPLGGIHASPELLSFFIATVSNIFVVGIKLAAPVAVSLLAATTVLGIMARAFPQMNVFLVSMPLNIGLGFLILGISLIVFMKTIENSFSTIPSTIQTLFRLLG